MLHVGKSVTVRVWSVNKEKRHVRQLCKEVNVPRARPLSTDSSASIRDRGFAISVLQFHVKHPHIPCFP